MVLFQSSVADVSTAVATGGLDTAFAGAQPAVSAVSALASLAVPEKGDLECIQADLRFLLDDGNVGAAFYVTLEANCTLSIQGFAGLERGRTHMRDVLTGVFNLPNSSVHGIVMLSGISHVWEVSSKGVAERETLEMHQSDNLFHVEALNSVKRLVAAGDRVPGWALLEATIEQVEEGVLYPDQLSSVISRADEDEQRQAQGEKRYLGLRPVMTIRRNVKRFTPTVPKEREDVRDKYELLANAWQMLYLRNPTRTLLRVFTLEFFSVALDFLFGEKVLRKTVKVGLGSVARRLVSSSWSLTSRYVNACSLQQTVSVRLVAVVKTAIHDTELYQDKFLTGLRVVSEWLPSTASSSSAPPRPSPAGLSAPIRETVEDLSMTVASLAKRKNSFNNIGANTLSKGSKGGNKNSAGRQQQQQGAGASPSDLLVQLQSLSSSFALRYVDPAPLITHRF